MGNCQAAEAATVVIQHPGGKVERVYWSLSASEVMGSNPGHYVAVVVAAPPQSAAGGKGATGGADGSSVPVRHLKLLRPDDTLHIGHVYRLISFEEVLKEFAAKKHVKLSRLLLAQQQQEERRKKRERGDHGRRGHDGASTVSDSSSSMVEHPQQQPQQLASRQREEDDVHANAMGVGSSIIGGDSRPGGAATRHGQWRPSLQSIAEAGN